MYQILMILIVIKINVLCSQKLTITKQIMYLIKGQVLCKMEGKSNVSQRQTVILESHLYRGSFHEPT